MKNLLALASLLLAVGSAIPARADIDSDYLDDKDKAISKYDPFEQWIVLANDIQEYMNPAYIADALGDKLSALGRTGFIRRCMKSDTPAVWAMCQGDIDQFDAAKALAEVDADTAHARDHESAKKFINDMKTVIPAHAAKVKALFGQDDAYKKMFDLAAEARKQTYGSPELRAIVMEMDDARQTKSRKAMAGCEEKIWPLWVKAVSAIPAKSFPMTYKDVAFEAVTAHTATIVGTPDGYLAAVALTTCLPIDSMTATLFDGLYFWPGFRGPRNAAVIAMMSAGLQLDKGDAKIVWPGVDRRRFFTNNGNGAEVPYTGGRAGIAPLASVKPNGDKVHLTYGSIKAKETKCVDYKAGKRLSRIESDGRLVYEGTCYKYADVMVDFGAPPPADVVKHYATGLKAGMYVYFSGNEILNARPTAASKLPTIVFGAPVK